MERFLKELESVLTEHKHIPEYMRHFENQLFAFDFRHHLYAPLICVKSAGLQLQISPVALNNDERRFVDYLKDYTEKHSVDLEGKSLYLLRNKSKSGIGFFEADNFYHHFCIYASQTDWLFVFSPKVYPQKPPHAVSGKLSSTPKRYKTAHLL